MKKTLIICCLLLASLSTQATHLRAGFIKAERVGPAGSLTYKFTLVVYTNTKNTPVKFGGDPDISYINFGDGEREFVPEQENLMRLDLDPTGSLAMASYSVTHTYASEGSYTVYYQEPNRNAQILNMASSVTTLFYVETQIRIGAGFVSTPSILAEPILYSLNDEEFTYSIAAKDSVDQTLFYELTAPQSAPHEPVTNYSLPENFSINNVNGLITWDTKFHGTFQPGEYSFAARIYQMSDGVLRGYMTFDFQIILEDGAGGGLLSANEDVNEHGRIHTPSGSSKKIKVFAEGTMADVIRWTAYTELSNEVLFGDNFSFTTYDSTKDDRKIKVGVLEVNNDQQINRDNPYAIVLRADFSRSTGDQRKDIGYLFYTKDVELEFPDIDPEIVLGVDEDNSLLSFYPNPTQDFVFVDESVKSIKLITLEGKQIISQDCTNKSFLDVREIKPGAYLLLLRSKSNKQSVARLIKK